MYDPFQNNVHLKCPKKLNFILNVFLFIFNCLYEMSNFTIILTIKGRLISDLLLKKLKWYTDTNYFELDCVCSLV